MRLAMAKPIALLRATKGDFEGHPFRGNQHVAAHAAVEAGQDVVVGRLWHITQQEDFVIDPARSPLYMTTDVALSRWASGHAEGRRWAAEIHPGVGYQRGTVALSHPSLTMPEVKHYDPRIARVLRVVPIRQAIAEAKRSEKFVDLRSLLKYSPDQPRDDHGRFAEAGNGGDTEEDRRFARESAARQEAEFGRRPNVPSVESGDFVLARDMTMYHGTTAAALDSILKEGLVGGKAEVGREFARRNFYNFADIGGRNTSVYLTDNEDRARMFASYAREVTHAKPVVLAIDIPKGELKLRIDERGNFETPMEMLRTKERIPPDWIRVISKAVGGDHVTVYVVFLVGEAEKSEAPHTLLKFRPDQLRDDHGRFATEGAGEPVGGEPGVKDGKGRLSGLTADQMIARAVDKFGTLPAAAPGAAYVLPDGSFLNFTKDGFTGRYDHRHIEQIFRGTKLFDGTDAMLEFARTTGAVRMHYEGKRRLYVQFYAKPTDAQVRTIAKIPAMHVEWSVADSPSIEPDGVVSSEEVDRMLRRVSNNFAAKCVQVAFWKFDRQMFRLRVRKGDFVVDVKNKLLKFDPDQPRAPAGSPDGGQWTGAGGGGGARDLYERISKPDGGFTYQPESGDEPKAGYAVSPYEARSFAKDAKDFTADDLIEYVRKNREMFDKPDHYLGGWHDPESGRIFLDISVVSAKQEDAERIAREHDQIAIFSLAEGRSITVNREATSGGAAKADRGYNARHGERHEEPQGEAAQARARLRARDDGRTALGAVREADRPQIHARGDRTGEEDARAVKQSRSPDPDLSKFDPDQARVPAGSSEGGQWASSGGGAGAATTDWFVVDKKGRILYRGPAARALTYADNHRRNFSSAIDVMDASGVSHEKMPPPEPEMTVYGMVTYGIGTHGIRTLAEVLGGRRSLTGARPERPYIKYDEDQPRDERGRWTETGEYKGEVPAGGFRANTPEFLTDGHTFESQAKQYPAKGPKGIGYFKGVLGHGKYVNSLLYRDDKGKVVGILNHFPMNIPPYERKGNFTVMVEPGHQRQGIGTALVREAGKRWDIDLARQNYTPSGAAMARALAGKQAKLRVKKFDPDQPRVPAGDPDGGQWTSGGGAGGDVTERIGTPDTKGVAWGPDAEGKYHVYGDVETAVALLGEGHQVVLQQPREVAALLDRLADIGKEMNQPGATPKVYDLCRVSVAGTNLFCAESKGYARVTMPQLGGFPLPGTLAAGLPRSAEGGVELAHLFAAELVYNKDVNVERTMENAAYLRPSQRELDGAKVAGIMRSMRERGVKTTVPMFVSSDNYIIDGHHRWAAMVALNYTTGRQVDVDIYRVDMPITSLLDEARSFAARWGVPQSEQGKFKALWAEFAKAMIERELRKEFTSSGSATSGLTAYSIDDDGDILPTRPRRMRFMPARDRARVKRRLRLVAKDDGGALAKYREDQERDDHGRWTDEGRGGKTGGERTHVTPQNMNKRVELKDAVRHLHEAEIETVRASEIPEQMRSQLHIQEPEPTLEHVAIAVGIGEALHDLPQGGEFLKKFNESVRSDLKVCFAHYEPADADMSMISGPHTDIMLINTNKVASGSPATLIMSGAGDFATWTVSGRIATEVWKSTGNMDAALRAYAKAGTFHELGHMADHHTRDMLTLSLADHLMRSHNGSMTGIAKYLKENLSGYAGTAARDTTAELFSQIAMGGKVPKDLEWWEKKLRES